MLEQDFDQRWFVPSDAKLYATQGSNPSLADPSLADPTRCAWVRNTGLEPQPGMAPHSLLY